MPTLDRNPKAPKLDTRILAKHVEAFAPDVRKAIVAEAKLTAAKALEDGADTKHGQGRLHTTLGRATTPEEQAALVTCIYALIDSTDVS